MLSKKQQRVKSLITNNTRIMTAISELCEEQKFQGANAVQYNISIIAHPYYPKDHPMYTASGMSVPLLEIPTK